MQLFSSFRLGHLDLPQRVVMAPMTRSRAEGGVPNALMAEYYAQRASAGLIITEGIAPSPNGLGYARIPGLFSAAQVTGWRRVTEAVHAVGGHIVAQLMHTGRIGHPANLPAGARILAPSAIAAGGTMYTDTQGPQPMPPPEAMSAEELGHALDEHVQAAKNAMHAGFDGVELHAANGYLLEQFLHPHSNRRTDDYGGGAIARNRFVVEVARTVADAIGRERVGIRLSPFNTFNDLPLHDEVEEQYVELVESLQGLVYVHVVRNEHPRFPGTLERIRQTWSGPIMLNGGFDRERAEAAIASGSAELISFGAPFIANPDLVERMRRGTAWSAPDPTTFYTPGPRGYTDYPALGA